MVEIGSEDLLNMNRTAWRPYFEAALSVADAHQTPPGPAPLTLGVKHSSDFEERRRTLATLITSVRERHPILPILVAYDGAHGYEPQNSGRFSWLRLHRY